MQIVLLLCKRSYEKLNIKMFRFDREGSVKNFV